MASRCRQERSHQRPAKGRLKQRRFPFRLEAETGPFMRTAPARLDVLPTRTAAVMRLLAALVVLLAVGFPLMWGIARVAVNGGGDAVASVDGSSATTASLREPARPTRQPG
jgi:hypothetical protein